MNIFLIILFIFSIFSQVLFRLGTLQWSALVSILMVIYFVMESLIRGRFIIVKYPIQKPLILLLLWSLFSLIISYSLAIPREIYDYSWTKGINSPEWRGIAFLLRLFLSIFTVQFIISNVKTKKYYYKIINYFLFGYSLLCIMVLIQAILYGFFDKIIGSVISDGSAYFRVGLNVEPSVLASILITGYFLLLALIIKYNRRIWLSKNIIMVLFIISTLDILLTFSAAWIPAAIFAGFFVGRKYLSKKILTYGFLLVALAFLFSVPFAQYVIDKIIGELSSIGIRTTSWIAGIYIFLDNPIFGVGIGNSSFYTPIYVREFLGESKIILGIFGVEGLYDIIQNTYYSSRFPPLNTYIQWAAETGLIGLSILSYLFYSIIRYGSNMPKCDHKFLVKFGFGGALLAFAFGMNSVADYLYLGGINFILAMYITGIKIFKNDNQSFSNEYNIINK